jgi:4-amino-4-deoxy-L-arabinose transferase-like glycosyltransferase
VGILFWLLRKKLSLLLAGALAIGLTIVEPLALLYPFDHQLYLGYIGINTFHNPTILFLKPFAILQLYYAVQTFQKKDSDWKAILITFLVSAAAAFAKPNYIICLLPAMGIIALYHIFKRKIIDWKKLLIGIVLPSVAILIWQFLLTYGSSQEGGIILAPFEVMLVFLSAKFVQISPLINQDIYRVIYLPAKFLLSIVFPVVVTVVYCKEAFKDIRMKLGWIGFGMGVIYTYFFAESTRFSAGNFAWSGQITLFILFICCILFLAEKKLQGINRLSKWLIYISGFLHIIFGIIYYLVVLLTHRYY